MSGAKKKTPKAGRDFAAEAGECFATFWALYPRKVSKQAAAEVWLRLTNDMQDAALAAIPDHAALWKRQARPKDKIPHASTWLNGRCWEDELADEQTERPARELPWLDGGGA